ncbi:MAG: hypothetical protein AAFZ49_10200, partial [Cyanobacteria bacterium J06659_2]
MARTQKRAPSRIRGEFIQRGQQFFSRRFGATGDTRPSSHSNTGSGAASSNADGSSGQDGHLGTDVQFDARAGRYRATRGSKKGRFVKPDYVADSAASTGAGVAVETVLTREDLQDLFTQAALTASGAYIRKRNKQNQFKFLLIDLFLAGSLIFFVFPSLKAMDIATSPRRWLMGPFSFYSSMIFVVFKDSFT